MREFTYEAHRASSPSDNSLNPIEIDSAAMHLVCLPLMFGTLMSMDIANRQINLASLSREAIGHLMQTPPRTLADAYFKRFPGRIPQNGSRPIDVFEIMQALAFELFLNHTSH